MCLGVEAIDYGIDVACFWEEVGSKGNKRGGVEAIYTINVRVKHDKN